MVVAFNKDNLRRRFLQRLGGSQAAKASAHDDDYWFLLRHTVLPKLLAGQLSDGSLEVTLGQRQAEVCFQS
jgi:hypothetical protein